MKKKTPFDIEVETPNPYPLASSMGGYFKGGQYPLTAFHACFIHRETGGPKALTGVDTGSASVPNGE